MPANHLEQLIAEWYEFRGYFVRRNVRVGPLPAGGFECELDVVAFDPISRHLVHIEPSNDADNWARREERYTRKFAAGQKYIPRLFEGLDLPPDIEQIAVLGFASTKSRSTLGGGKLMLVRDLLSDILTNLKERKFAKNAVPEQFPLLRTLQLVAENRISLSTVLA